MNISCDTSIEEKELYYICHNGFCNHIIKARDVFKYTDIEYLPPRIYCECCKDEMILTVKEED